MIMGDAQEDVSKAMELPEGDVIRILLTQHARIRKLFDEIEGAAGAERLNAFRSLCSLLAAHETAEQVVLRPVSRQFSPHVADERTHEEEEATEVLSRLERLDVDSAEFTTGLAAFKAAVSEHAEAEEHQEFAVIVERCSVERRRELGDQVDRAEQEAQSAPAATGRPTDADVRADEPDADDGAIDVMEPFVHLLNRVRDALSTKS